MKTAELEATPKKLRDGNWGARVGSESVQVGDVIKITTRSGKSWLTTVSKVVWAGEGISIVATASSKSRHSNYVPATRNARGYVEQRGHYHGYCGYPCPVTGKKCCPANGPCHDCR